MAPAPRPAPLSVNWDEIIAEKVAGKVLAEIGDQLKMSAPMAELMARVMGPWEYTHLLPGSAVPSSGIYVRLRWDNTRVRIMFMAIDGTHLMEREFHA